MLYTDTSNGKEFAELFKNTVRWNKTGGGWYIYNGKIWQQDENDTIKKYTIQFFEKLQEDLRTFHGDEHALELFSKHVKNTGDWHKQKALLEIAKAYSGEPHKNFDAKPELFNCHNGTINLKTLKFQPFNRDDLLTSISNINYNQEATCPKWRTFLKDIFLNKQEDIDFIQRVIGYSLTASTKEHCLFILYGVGNNGKSIFVDTISKMLGDYGVTAPQSALIQKKQQGIPNNIAFLKSARFVLASESNQSVSLDEALIKSLTGDDTMSVRFLNKEFFTFTPMFKIFILTNHKPNIRGTDTGIWRRVILIPFDLKISKEKEDKNLKEKLRKELDGIFLWAIEGYKEWLKQGLNPPPSILNATKNYRDEEDDLGRFIADYYIADVNGRSSVNVFKKQFMDVSGYKKSQKTMSEYMQNIGVKCERVTIKGSQVRCWIGLRPITIFEQ